MFNEAVDAVNASAALKYGADEIKAMRMQTDPEVYPDVDWQKLLMKKVSLSEKVSANISGGGPLLHGPLLLQPRGAVCCQTRRIFMGERQDRPLRRECQLQAL